MRDYEKNEMSKIKLKVNQELRKLQDDWEREKEAKENEFLMQKLKVEQEAENEFLEYK